MTKKKADATTAEAQTEDNLSVYSDNVALPEVRTGHVDVEGDFAKDQDAQNNEQEQRVSFDTVAVPEFHTGKCPPSDPGCKDHADEEPASDGKRKHHLFGDLARILANGGPEE